MGRRIASGLVLVALTFSIALYSGALLFSLAVAAVTIVSLLEYNNLRITASRDGVLDALLVVSGGALPLLGMLSGLSPILPAIILSVFSFFLAAMLRGGDMRDSLALASHKATGIVYVALPLSYFIHLRGLQNGPMWVLFLFTVIWANDTFAYIGGKALGSHQLAPLLSPKKTIEGGVAGIISGIIAGALYNHYLGMGLSIASAIALCLAIGLVALAGDLSESFLKRAAGVKDSGSIIPGHGGVLDRIDSLLFAVPLLYYSLSLSGRAFF